MNHYSNQPEEEEDEGEEHKLSLENNDKKEKLEIQEYVEPDIQIL